MDILTGLEGDLVTVTEIPVGPPCTQEDEHKPEKLTLKEQYYEGVVLIPRDCEL